MKTLPVSAMFVYVSKKSAQQLGIGNRNFTTSWTHNIRTCRRTGLVHSVVPHRKKFILLYSVPFHFIYFIYPASIVRDGLVHLPLKQTGRPDHLSLNTGNADLSWEVWCSLVKRWYRVSVEPLVAADVWGVEKE